MGRDNIFAFSGSDRPPSVPLVAISAHVNDQTPAVHNPSQWLVYYMKLFVATNAMVDA